MTESPIGVDISKSHPDVFRREDEGPRRFANSAAGFRALVTWLGRSAVARIVFEATGPDHRAFETALSGKYPLVKVNPLQARRFAEACGTRAKTDAVDVQPWERHWSEGPQLCMLARMGAALALEPDEPYREKLN